jgi:hypothetical protein
MNLLNQQCNYIINITLQLVYMDQQQISDNLPAVPNVLIARLSPDEEMHLHTPLVEG